MDTKLPFLDKPVHHNFGSWFKNEHYESDVQGEPQMILRPDCSIILPIRLVDDFGWKTMTQLHIMDYDKDLQQITIGKKLTGDEAVTSAEKIASLFT